MSNFVRAFFVAVATATAAGCAHTSMTSMLAPEIRGRSFRSVLVDARVGDLGLKIAMEDRFSGQQAAQQEAERAQRALGQASDQVHCVGTPAQVERGRHDEAFVDSLIAACHGAMSHTRFVPSHSVFFPGRDYSSEEVVAAMRERGIDATLVITPGETGSTQGYVPPTYTTTCTNYNVNGGCAQTTATPIGGFSYSKPWAQFSAKLYDAANGQAVWVATATSGGSAFAQSADLVVSMADKTVERLRADGVIR